MIVLYMRESLPSSGLSSIAVEFQFGTRSIIPRFVSATENFLLIFEPRHELSNNLRF